MTRPLIGRRVVVIGGGLAGLTAALDCADMGGQVTLLERRSRLGGLTWSFEHDGLTMDNGQHVYLACCQAYRGFLDRIGASGDVEPARPLDIPVVAPGPGRPVVGRLRRRRLPVPLHLAGSLMSYRHLGRSDRLGLGRALAGLYRLRLDDPRLDDITFGQWLAEHGQSPAAVSAVWDLITVPTVNLPAAEASLASAAKVFKTGVLGAPGAADMGWSRVPLGRLHGERAAVALSRSGVTVRTGEKVETVRQDAAGWTVGTRSGSIDTDAVVMAVAHEEATELVPPGSVGNQSRWPDLGSSAVVDVHLVFDRQVTSWPVMAGHRSDIQWVFDRTDPSGLSDRQPGAQYLAVSLSAADHLISERPQDLITSTVGALAALLPEVPSARLISSLVTKERRATFRAAPGTAGARPAPETNLPGLVLAGAWTDTGWPATMEGAVLSGRAAARILSSNIPLRRSTQEVA
ncbi:MAG TPA: hydroxysqualene dehydroxylase HpnE [Acidimicrobiales bacterium]|jgi:squalene-associated FAD-dependent desaturase|nr:hydroxysqualene dehydroxylase HpnE [Acidimicrobiales bacterium]